MNKPHRATDFPVLYINLEKDAAKKTIIEKNLKNVGFRFNRINAIYGKKLYDSKYRTNISTILNVPSNKLSPEYWLDRSNFKTMSSSPDVILPKVGAYLSHLLAIKTALDKKYNSVLILEDDAAPLKNINESFTIPQDADIFYLGGTFFHQITKIPNNNDKHIKINIEKLKMCGGFAYIIPNRESLLDAYNLLMSVFNDENNAHDKHDEWRSGYPKMRAQTIDFMYINHFQKNGKCYIVNPVKFTHEEMGSNIVENRSRYDLKFFYNDLQQKQLLNK
jgi:hypothetical protein